MFTPHLRSPGADSFHSADSVTRINNKHPAFLGRTSYLDVSNNTIDTGYMHSIYLFRYPHKVALLAPDIEGPAPGSRAQRVGVGLQRHLLRVAVLRPVPALEQQT